MCARDVKKVIFNPLMSGGKKGHTYLNKPAVESFGVWRWIVCAVYLLINLKQSHSKMFTISLLKFFVL